MVYDLAQPNEHTKPPLATLVALILTVVPQWFQERGFDLLNILAFLAWGRRYALSRRHLLVGVLFTLNAWNAEIRLGQYNLFTLWGILWAAEGTSPLRGGGLALALLFKPVNLVFLPWVACHGENRRQLLLSTAAAFAGLALLYIGLFGTVVFWNDHLTWWRFIPTSVNKHLLRDDNYGLPSLFAQFGVNQLQNLWLFLGLGAAALIARREKSEALTWTAIVCIAVSPMAWLQNYSLLLGSNLLWLTQFLKTRSRKMVAALLLIEVFHQGWNPTLKPYLGPFSDVRIPLLALLVASLFAAVDLHSARHSDKRLASD